MNMERRSGMPHLKAFGRDAIGHDYIHSDSGEKYTAKETLAVIQNAWLHTFEIEKAHRMGDDPDVTEEQAEEYRKTLEIACSERLAYWRMYQ